MTQVLRRVLIPWWSPKSENNTTHGRVRENFLSTTTEIQILYPVLVTWHTRTTFIGMLTHIDSTVSSPCEQNSLTSAEMLHTGSTLPQDLLLKASESKLSGSSFLENSQMQSQRFNNTINLWKPQDRSQSASWT